MKWNIHILFFFLQMPFYLNAQSDQILELRKKYKIALNDPKEAENFYQVLSKQKMTDPVEMAYLGASQALMAKNAKILNKKRSYLKESEKSFDMAIQMNAGNIEIRFLRFGIIQHLPTFIKDRKKMTDDKQVIIQNLSKAESHGLGKVFKKEIVDFMLNADGCTEEEKKQLKSIAI